MKRIEEKFKQLKNQREKALIPFIAAGDPSLPLTKALILGMERQGADMIELGIPFSDPLADGPTIQKAYLRGLKSHTTLKDVLKLVRELREETDIPLIIMSYYNLIYRMGEASFVQQAAQAGVDGLIVPDLPPEEGEFLQSLAEEAGLAAIYLLAPTTPDRRVQLIAQKGSGFLYYVSLMGVTGERDNIAQDVTPSLQNIRALTNMPIAVGFGISSPEHVRSVASWVDGVIVGSAVIKLIEDNLARPNLVGRVGKFIAQLKAATRDSTPG
ncbi:MAG: tryptophan synthase subunit alpha [Nitrospinae bacterium RIFCSPLOWO2_12_FULL_45_22]|nr:MAG: tryptophan synthase subunit alpha [Nitrospinae bacterium RIFCSPLOWO2_12_FULL_45_22]